MLMLGALVLMDDATRDSTRFSQLYSTLLIVTVTGLLALLVLIGLNVRSLLRQLFSKVPGSLLTTRMVVMITALSVTPVLLLYYFSLGFLNRGIDSWFDMRVESALEDSLELSRLSLDERMRELLRDSEQLALKIARRSDDALAFEIDSLRQTAGALELALFERGGEIVLSSIEDPSQLVPERVNENIQLQLEQGNSYIGLEADGEGGVFIRVAANVNVPESGLEGGARFIQALYPVSERINELAGSVEGFYGQYQRLSYLRTRLKLSFILTLTLVLLFSVFSCVWAVFIAARRLVSPIRELARGTREVSAGRYDTRLPVARNDELGFLVTSFNEMTQKVASARREAENSHRAAEAEKAYLQAVLERISSGVLVLDARYRLRTCNAGAAQLLDAPLHLTGIGKTCEELGREHERLRPLMERIERRLKGDAGNWQEQITLLASTGYRRLRCNGTSPPELLEGGAGHVMVLEDVTRLVQSQRDAAWQEAARRLAHEIKNPLTPIQLAAERLRERYPRLLPPGQDGLLHRLTGTIVHQVHTLKEMVNSFSDYAQPAHLQLETQDLNLLLSKTIDLYRNVDASVEIATELEDLPLLRLDTGKMTRVFNNLLNNALAARSPDWPLRVHVHTRLVGQGNTACVEIRFRDTGQGVEEEILDKLFEPYVTSKTKGTGLGLPIVRRLVEEHGGTVWLENNDPPPGACAVIQMPLARPRAADDHATVGNEATATAS